MKKIPVRALRALLQSPLLLCALSCGGAAGAAAPAPAPWRNVTPGFLNVGHDADVRGDMITLLTDIGGVLRSTDAGKTWRTLSHTGAGEVTNKTFAPLAVHPQNPAIILFGGAYVYRTGDEGAHWHECAAAPFPAPRLRTRSTQISCIKFTADGAAVFCGIGTDPLRPKLDWEKMHARFHSGKTIYRSIDNGRDWQRIEIAPGPHVPMRCLVTDPAHPQVVYAAFDDGTLYRTADALAPAPSFTLLHTIADGYLGSAAVSPFGAGTLVGAVVGAKGARGNPGDGAVLLRCASPGDARPEIETIPAARLRHLLPAGAGKNLRPGTVAFDPNRKGRLAIGLFGNPHLLLSEDDGATFACKSLPARAWRDINQPAFFGNIERIYYGAGAGYAIALSYIGAFKSDPVFARFETLLMDVRRDEHGAPLLGNTGAATVSNINDITIGDDYVYWVAQDHGAWRAPRGRETHWRHITSHDEHDYLPKQPADWGEIDWFWKVVGIGAPPSGKTVFVIAVSHQDYKTLSFRGRKHMYRSDDAGGTWRDITPAFGAGAELPAGGTFRKMLFAPGDPRHVWLLLSDRIYYSSDGGARFARVGESALPRFPADSRTGFTDLAFNQTTGELLLGTGNQHALPDESEQPHWLHRSPDKGKTWTPLDTGLCDIHAIAAAQSGDWIIGTGATAHGPARLARLPADGAGGPVTLLTLGASKQEREACQLAFYPVIADGPAVLAYGNTKWFHSDRIYAQGAWLSPDGGKNWRPAGREFPTQNIWSAAMRDGVIYIGTTFGLMRAEINDLAGAGKTEPINLTTDHTD
jgi:photosystem II stability/assembly factor-like uncharacterized protein